MKSYVLFFLAVTFSFHAHAKWEDPCEMFLNSTQLSIGVLGESRQGERYLGISSYVSSNHNHIVDSLIEIHGVWKILWMGELRHYRDSDGRPIITEANETSGFYNEVKNGKKVKGIYSAQNHIDDLPPSLRASSFRGWTFDKENLHLLTELNSLKNIRHDVNTSLQLVSLSISVLKRPVDQQKALHLLARFNGERHRDIRLIRWLMNYVVQSKKVSVAEFAELQKALKLLEDGDAEGLSHGIDDWQVREQIWLLSHLLTKMSADTRVEIFSVEAN